MITFLGHRRTAVMLFGLIALLVTVAQPPWARSDVSDRVEPWLERCLISTAGCVDCDSWCQVRVGEHCEEAFHVCEGPPNDECDWHEWMNTYEECSCRVGSGVPEL